ncbi:MAG: hypothetical protein J0L86_05445 [Flavobacteriales bacterium]|nr:hypothetical protein [Flavobacteriales bacterium]
MSNLNNILIFLLLYKAMDMAFPQRAEKSTKYFVLIIKNLPITKLLEVLIEYFKRDRKK